MTNIYVYGAIITCIIVLCILIIIIWVKYIRLSTTFEEEESFAQNSYSDYDFQGSKGILKLPKKYNQTKSIICNNHKSKKSVEFNLTKTKGILFGRIDPPDQLQKNSLKYGKYIMGEIPYRKYKFKKLH